MNERTIILLDIDGTLLDVRGAGRRSFVLALEAVWGWRDDIAYINFSGATDLDVLRQILARHGRQEAPEDAGRFFAELARTLERELAGQAVEPYPGVRALLDALSADPRAVVGLVTGNVEPCARIKLRAAGLDGHFLPGAFGQEHADRAEIARLALARARAHAGAARIGGIFLIGDTPADIAAAHAIGATAIAVATGRHSVADLERTGADAALDGLADLPRVLGLLGLGSSGSHGR